MMGHSRSTAYRLLMTLDRAFGGTILVTTGGSRRKRRKAVTAALQEALRMREAGEVLTLKAWRSDVDAWREHVDAWRQAVTDVLCANKVK